MFDNIKLVLRFVESTKRTCARSMRNQTGVKPKARMKSFTLHLQQIFNILNDSAGQCCSSSLVTNNLKTMKNYSLQFTRLSKNNIPVQRQRLLLQFLRLWLICQHFHSSRMTISSAIVIFETCAKLFIKIEFQTGVFC